MKKERFTFFESNPELYEQGFSYRTIDQQVNFLDKIFQKNRCKKILDIACGHSPQGILLAKKGYDVSGIDISGPLLKLGKQRASEKQVDFKFYKKNMSNFYIGKFDAAYILFSSILHLYKKEDLINHFKSVSNNLKRDGLYILDISSLPFDSPLKPKKIKYSNGGLTTTVEYLPKDILNLTASFNMKSMLKNRIVNNDKFNILMFLPLPILFSLAVSNEFKIENLYSNFYFNRKLSKNRPEYIAILRRK